MKLGWRGMGVADQSRDDAALNSGSQVPGETS
jgi:hypothetical protein